MAHRESSTGARRPVHDDVLAEQLAYYRARAAEYDQWFSRLGRYDRGEAATARWHAELDEVRGWLDELALEGTAVLELGSGTGLWTLELVARGATVTALDAAPEMHGALARRLEDAGASHRVSTVLADLYEWAPPRRYDAVVACFVMSHVPDERLDRFLATVAGALTDGGRVLLVDSRPEPTSTAADHVLPVAGDQTMLRALDDGRTYRIVKRFRDDDELVAAAARHGLDAQARRTRTYFQGLLGRRR